MWAEQARKSLGLKGEVEEDFDQMKKDKKFVKYLRETKFEPGPEAEMLLDKKFDEFGHGNCCIQARSIFLLYVMGFIKSYRENNREIFDKLMYEQKVRAMDKARAKIVAESKKKKRTKKVG